MPKIQINRLFSKKFYFLGGSLPLSPASRLYQPSVFRHPLAWGAFPPQTPGIPVTLRPKFINFSPNCIFLIQFLAVPLFLCLFDDFTCRKQAFLLNFTQNNNK